jgi:hypothetical protein
VLLPLVCRCACTGSMFPSALGPRRGLCHSTARQLLVASSNSVRGCKSLERGSLLFLFLTQAHCPESSDLLPGVYALTQCWMQQGILGSFRQQAGAVATEQQPPADVDLAPWFDSLLVRAVILVRPASSDLGRKALH